MTDSMGHAERDGAAADVASIAAATAIGAAKGGHAGAAREAVRAAVRTRTGRRAAAVVACVAVAVAMMAGMVATTVVGMVATVADIPNQVTQHAAKQIIDFFARGLSAVAGDPDALADEWSAGEAPWAALYALAEDAARHPGLGDGMYGFDPALLTPDGVDLSGLYHGSGLSPAVPENVLRQHYLGCVDAAGGDTASSVLAHCLLTAAMRAADPVFTRADVFDGVEEYTADDGGKAYRVVADDPAGQHARAVFTAVFAAMPIPGAASRATGLYDLMIAAALGIMDSCGTGPTAVGTVTDGAWSDPLLAPSTSGYGWRVHPVDGTAAFHQGADMGAPCGTEIHAAAAGTVVFADWSGGYGGLTTIDHGGGVRTNYAHQEVAQMSVAAGDVVEAGQVIGLVGTTGTSTGCHLHFEARVDGAVDGAGGDSVDPVAFMADRGVVLGVTEPVSSAGPAIGPTDDPLHRDGQTTSGFTAMDASGTAYVMDATQVGNARVIVAVGRGRDASDVAIVAALAAAMVETNILSLASEAVPGSADYPHDGVAAGDADSVGVFQQRGPWGTVAERMDVAQSAGLFFDAAAAVGAEGMSPGALAAAVQRPAGGYAGRYTAVESTAEALYRALAGVLAGASAQCGATAGEGGYSADSAGIARAAQDMAAWGGAYLWGGGHGSLGDLESRIQNRFTGGRIVPASETPDGDTDSPVPDEWGVDCSGFVRAVIWVATGRDTEPNIIDRGTGAVRPMAAAAGWVVVPGEKPLPGDVFFTAGHTGVVVAVDVPVDGGGLGFMSAESYDVGKGMGVATHPYSYVTHGWARLNAAVADGYDG